jgi:hypothetical protein
MQFLLIKGGVLPGEYYSLPEGEKIVIRALFDDYASGL